MTQVKFTATESMKAYVGCIRCESDGQVCEVSETDAEYLTKTFPKNFKKVSKPMKDKLTKQMRPERDK